VSQLLGDMVTVNEGARDPRDARIQKLEERMNDMIHKAELRELIEKWEQTDWETQEANLMARECATDVREVLGSE